MARLFDDANDEYLGVASAPIADVPLTLFAWFNSDSNSAIQTILCVRDTDVLDWHIMRLRGDVGGDPLEIQSRENPTSGGAQSSSGYTVGTWHTATAVFATSTSRTIYIDGGSSNSDATDLTPASLDATYISNMVRASYEYPFSGSIAEAAIWSVALAAGEIATLAAGYSPLFVRPASLVAYWPLGGIYNDGNAANVANSDWDIVGGYHMDPQNTPSVADHPPQIIYPAPAFYPYTAAAAVVGQPTMRRWGGVPFMRIPGGGSTW